MALDQDIELQTPDTESKEMACSHCGLTLPQSLLEEIVRRSLFQSFVRQFSPSDTLRRQLKSVMQL